jgi:hypothetical protein
MMQIDDFYALVIIVLGVVLTLFGIMFIMVHIPDNKSFALTFDIFTIWFFSHFGIRLINYLWQFEHLYPGFTLPHLYVNQRITANIPYLRDMEYSDNYMPCTVGQSAVHGSALNRLNCDFNMIRMINMILNHRNHINLTKTCIERSRNIKVQTIVRARKFFSFAFVS